MKAILLSLLALAVVLIFAGSVAAQEEKPLYWTLVSEAAGTPSGHLIVRIPPGRVAPNEWDINWFVSIYTPKGYRLPLEYVEDRSSLGDGSRIVLRLPPGTHRIEITRSPPSKQGMGVFDLDKGEWIPWDTQAVLVSRAAVPLLANQVRILDITYRNPQARSQREGDTTTTLLVWEDFALIPSAGQTADLPKRDPKPYPLTEDVALDVLDQSHLVNSLKAKEGREFAEMALLRVQKPQLGAVLAGLSDKSITLSWDLARVLANARDARTVAVLTNLLEDASSEAGARAPAAWVLGQLGDPGAAPALKAALRDPEPMVRSYAALAIGQLKPPGAVPALVGATRDTTGYVGGSIFVTVRESPGFYHLSPDQRSLFSFRPIPSFMVRLNALYALGEVGDPAAIEPLSAFLNDSDEQVCLAALRGLGNYQGARVVEALKSKLTERQSVRFVAVHLLAKRGDARVLDALDKLAKEDPDTLVRQAATDAAARIRKRLQPAPPARPPKKESAQL